MKTDKGPPFLPRPKKNLVSGYPTVCPKKKILKNVFFFNFTIDKILIFHEQTWTILPVQFVYINVKIEMEIM